LGLRGPRVVRGFNNIPTEDIKHTQLPCVPTYISYPTHLPRLSIYLPKSGNSSAFQSSYHSDDQECRGENSRGLQRRVVIKQSKLRYGKDSSAHTGQVQDFGQMCETTCCYRLWASRRPGMGRILVYIQEHIHVLAR